MSVRLVALKDVGDSMRQYHLHTSVGILALLFGVMAYLSTDPAQQVDGQAVPFGLASLGTFLVPLLAIGFAYGVVVGMRTRGDLKLLLGMPFSRRDVVLGSFAGRSVVVLASVFAGTALAALVALLRGAPLALDALVGAAGIVGVLGVAFVAISIAASASVSTETRASAITMGAYFLFVFDLWRQIPIAVVWLISGFELPRELPEWAIAVAHLNPVLAFRDALRPVLPEVAEMFGRVPDPIPVYRSVPVALVVLALWIVVPLAVGVARFDRTDL